MTEQNGQRTIRVQSIAPGNLILYRLAASQRVAPVHEGATKYFKEIGLWKEADDTRGEYNLRLMDWYCKAWDVAIVKADAQGIVVHSANEAWIELWTYYKKEIGIPGYRQMTDAEIKKGLSLLRSLGR